MNLYITYESHDTLKSFSLFLTVKTIWKLNTEHSVNLKKIEIQIIALVFHILLTTQILNISRCCFAEEAKKFMKIYNAHAQPLLCSLRFLFSDVPIAVAVMVFCNSLIPHSSLVLFNTLLSLVESKIKSISLRLSCKRGMPTCTV